MLIHLSKLERLPVASMAEEKRLGWVSQILLNPDTGELVGFLIKVPGFFVKLRALSARDVASYDQNALVIRSADYLVDPEEIKPIQVILEKKNQFIGKGVKTESGLFLGRVDEVIIQTDLEMLAKIHVSGLWGLGDSRIIARDDIVKITPKEIVVSESGAFPKNLVEQEVVSSG